MPPNARLGNERFHSIIGEMADNEYLTPSLRRLLIDHSRIGMTFHNPKKLHLAPERELAADQHDQFIALIEAGDADAAADLAVAQWELSRPDRKLRQPRQHVHSARSRARPVRDTRRLMTFEGIYTPAIAPCRMDGSIDRDAFAAQIEYLIAAGVHGIITGGSTGEYYARSMPERLEMASLARELTKGRVHLMIGTVAIRQDDSVAMAEHAARIGAASILIGSPPYAVPTEHENALNALAIDRAADLPVMLYNYPGRMGINMGQEFLNHVGSPPTSAPSRTLLATSTACTCWRATARMSGCPAAWTTGRWSSSPGARALLGLRRVERPARRAHRALEGLRRRGQLRQGPPDQVGADTPDARPRTGRQVIQCIKHGCEMMGQYAGPLATLRQLCAPASDIAIPLPPIAAGGCPLPVRPDMPALHALYGERNPILPQPPAPALNAHLGASALGSPILDQLLTATDWLAGCTGNPAAAEAYIAAMLRAYLPERAAGGDLSAALQRLSTEGGRNATLRAAMAPAGAEQRQGPAGFRPRLGLPEPKDRS